MHKASYLAAAAAALFISLGASPVLAQSHDWTGWQATLGASSVESNLEGEGFYNPYDLAPSGTVVSVGLNHRWNAGHIALGVYTNAQFGSVEASGSGISCEISDCGFEEIEYRTERTNYTVNAGLSAGHEIGPVLVSVLGGVTVGDYMRSVRYDVNGTVDYWYEGKGFRAGYHYGIAVEYAFTDRWSARLELRQTELIEDVSESPFYTDESGFSQTSATLEAGWKF